MGRHKVRKKVKSGTKWTGNGQNQNPTEDPGITFKVLSIRRVKIIKFRDFWPGSRVRALRFPQGRRRYCVASPKDKRSKNTCHDNTEKGITNTITAVVLRF